MRSYLTKALAVMALAALIGIPWGQYNEQAADDAATMTQEQWLAHMDYSQKLAADSARLPGTLVITTILITGLVCIYEFFVFMSGLVMDRLVGPSNHYDRKPSV